MPHVEIRDRHRVVTDRISLGEHGQAVHNDGRPVTEESIGAKVIAPGPRLVKPEDREEYLRTLPLAFRSPYSHAVFYPDES